MTGAAPPSKPSDAEASAGPTDPSDPTGPTAPAAPSGTSTVRRQTKETQVDVTLTLDGTGSYDVETDNRFLSHMLETWTRYAGFDLHVRATGDLDHHLVEDVAITVGQAFREAFGGAPCQRIAYDVVPMDDALVLCAVDVVDRPYYAGELPIPLYEHWFRSFAMEARINLHLDHMRGRDTHHAVEASFKAFARALRRALAPRDEEVSTKGVVQTDRAADRPSGAPGKASDGDAPAGKRAPGKGAGAKGAGGTGAGRKRAGGQRGSGA